MCAESFEDLVGGLGLADRTKVSGATRCDLRLGRDRPGSRCRAAGRAAPRPDDGGRDRGRSGCPSSRRVMTVSIPSLRHSASRTRVPPTGREEVNASSAGPTPVEPRKAVAGSSSRVSDVTSRAMASRSSWSSRPKLCSTFGRELFVAGSHSLWSTAGTALGCRPCFAVSPPYVHVSRRYTIFDQLIGSNIDRTCVQFPAVRRLPRHADPGRSGGVFPDQPISCGTRVQDHQRAKTDQTG